MCNTAHPVNDMANLNDVTRLFGGVPAAGDVITPLGSEGSSFFGKMQDNVQIDLADPQQISVADVMHWQGASYAVTEIYSANLLWSSMNTGVTVNGTFSYIVQLADTTDPSKTLTVWLPIDQELPLNYDLPFLPPQVQAQGTAASLTINSLTPITSIPWSDVDLNDNIDTICFGSDAMIDTDQGRVKAGNLKVGDLVRTQDASFQPVRWLASRHFSGADLAQKPHLRPIRIRAGALGAGVPDADLLVSPQHRILVRSAIAQRMFGAKEVLVAACELLGLDGVEISADGAEVTYVHFLFDSHHIVYANGAEAESLFTGVEAMRIIGAKALREILEIFPECLDVVQPVPARLLLRGSSGRRLVARHVQSEMPLLG